MATEPAHTLPWAGSCLGGVTVIHMQIYATDNSVAWHLSALRPADQWRTHGPWYWDRRGFVPVEEIPRTHRELISIALKAVQDRLGER